MLGHCGVSLIHLTPHMDYRNFHSFKAQKKITPGNCGITAFSPRTLITSNYHRLSWRSLMATVHWSNLSLDMESSQWVNVCDFYAHAYAQETGLYVYSLICSTFAEPAHNFPQSNLSLCTIESPPVSRDWQNAKTRLKKDSPPLPQNKKHWPFLWPLHSKCKNNFTNKYQSFLWHLPTGNQNYILYVGLSCDLYIQKEEGRERGDFKFQTVGLSCDL